MTSRSDFPRSRSPSSDSGFTLLEVMVVLVIAGLLLGVVVERGPFHSDTVTFGAAKTQVLSILQNARSAAMTSDQPTVVVFDASRREFVTRTGKRERIDRLTGSVVMTIPASQGGAAAQGEILFDANGATSGAPLLLTLGQRAVLFTVSPATGRILVDAP
ncbi:prepilin-type N-terminal cleavage/methylation domain-containing protein [Acetobacter sp. DsW_063]|uniref:prepilin-type N-terminal cleavage/methylation domain-containing protein n=1 Tax=Acetobacter sp. DsW_063 TaxID=1514894 RepID=UPI000A3A7C27|nr:prepilin-type N-terminal cleavage/methylation domain-containing protein [Acetobacter sp. DsW_063]